MANAMNVEEAVAHLIRRISERFPKCIINKDGASLRLTFGAKQFLVEVVMVPPGECKTSVGLAYNFTVIDDTFHKFDGHDCMFYNPNVLIKYIGKLR
ncbi:MAG: hypothetical protein KGH64_02945 [Candidatus Micrarchaeota archaeon]|nr:hypothetical protein [Candidatus Micrarchaeota archaeon]